MPNPNQSCGTCFFMKPQLQQDPATGVNMMLPTCRFQPPAPVVGPISQPAQWTRVDSDDWCGQWKKA